MGKMALQKLLVFAFLFLTVMSGRVAWAEDSAQKTPPKIVIFYSTIGMGHLSAARAIESSIKQKNPQAVVVMQDIRDFENPWTKKIGEKIYWYLVKNWPDTFDRMFRDKMTQGNQVHRLSQLSKGYNIDKIRQFLFVQGPNTVLATHYGSAEMLIHLRNQGHLRNVPIGWLHTDYFTGYFPRISGHIDMTFVGADSVREGFLQQGVPEERVTSSGIPVNPAVFEPIDRVAFLKSKNLDPNIKTVVIATGGEGVGDFGKIVESIQRQVTGPLQIIAVCAKSEENFKKLEKMKSTLRSGVNLQVHKFIPNVDLLSFVKSSDAYITKSGGLSPTEAFAIMKPTILLDIYGGHERDNAELFETNKLALINRDQSTIGSDLNRLETDQALREQMSKAQLAFRNSINLDTIGDFALSAKPTNRINNFYLGVEGGQEVGGTIEAIDRLNRESPSEVEIILSYPTAENGKHLGSSNPFGHLALRVGDKVYTANHLAKKGEDKDLLLASSLRDYLYSVNRPTVNAEHTSSFGLAYGRDNISIRLRGISPEQQQAMLAEVAKINQAYNDGKTSWTLKGDNCAKYTQRILEAGGLTVPELNAKPNRVTLPVDVFDGYRKSMEQQSAIQAEIVSYTYVADSQNMYKTARFPLSIYQLKRSVKNLLFDRLDPVEKMVTKRIGVPVGEADAKYENLNGRSAEQTARFEQEQDKALQQIKSMEAEIETQQKSLEASGKTTENLSAEIQKTLSALSPAARQLLDSGKVDSITNPTEKALAQKLVTTLRQFDEAQKAYQELNDKISNKQLDYFIEATMESVRGSYELAVRGRTSKAAKALEKLYTQATGEFKKFKANRDQFGKPKDGPLRTSPYRQFFAYAKTYFDTLNGAPEGQTVAAKSYWEGLRKKAAKVADIAYTLMKLTPKLVSVVVNAILRPITPPGEAPVTESMFNLLREAKDVAGIKVDIANKERLPTPKPLGASKTINLVVPTHRDSIMDAFLMSELGLGKAMLALAPDQFLPKSLANTISKVDTVVAVGRGPNVSIEQIVEQLSRNKTDTILIYPEGSVSAGFGETRPPREKFSWGLVELLVKEGYNVNITPVSYLNTDRFTYDANDMDLIKIRAQGKHETLKAVVRKTIDPDAVRVMVNNAGSASIGRWIRASWMESLGIDSDRINGMLRPEAVQQQMSERMRTNARPPTDSRSQSGPAGLRCEDLFQKAG